MDRQISASVRIVENAEDECWDVYRGEEHVQRWPNLYLAIERARQYAVSIGETPDE
jgi:hypothetical protein